MEKDDWNDRRFAAEWDEAGNLFTNPDRLNQLSLLADLVAGSAPHHLLDLGIGSAQVEALLNRRHPTLLDDCRVSGVDASAAMLERAKQRCKDEQLKNISFVEGDFAEIDKIDLIDTPDTVICVQALHEVTHQVKKTVFARVYQWLPAGRPFYILDRFDYPAGEWLSDWRTTWDWMASTVSSETLDFASYHRKYRAKSDHTASVQQYRDWLQEAGFESVCPYQCFNRAMIIARARST